MCIRDSLYTKLNIDNLSLSLASLPCIGVDVNKLWKLRQYPENSTIARTHPNEYYVNDKDGLW